MIKITVELISAVDPSRNTILGIGTIVNTGGNAAFGNYKATLGKMAPKESEAWRAGTLTFGDATDVMEGDVESFDRQRRGCWDLIYLTLKGLVGARNDVVGKTLVKAPRKVRAR